MLTGRVSEMMRPMTSSDAKISMVSLSSSQYRSRYVCGGRSLHYRRRTCARPWHASDVNATSQTTTQLCSKASCTSNQPFVCSLWRSLRLSSAWKKQRSSMPNRAWSNCSKDGRQLQSITLPLHVRTQSPVTLGGRQCTAPCCHRRTGAVTSPACFETVSNNIRHCINKHKWPPLPDSDVALRL